MSEDHEHQAALHRQLDSLDLREVVRVPAHSTIRETAALLRQMNVSSALVGDAPREIVTERDLTRALAEGRGPDDEVENIVERTPLWASTTSHVIDAAEMMLNNGIRHLIVLGVDGKAAGVVSMRDILALLLPHAGLAEVTKQSA